MENRLYANSRFLLSYGGIYMRAYIYKAKCINIVDGDTADFIIDAGFRITTTQRLRFVGIDTPERGQPGFREATEFTREHLLDKECYVHTEKSDVFGRYLATIYLPHGEANDGTELFLNFNEYLLQEGFAKPYLR